jgi:hypothetical protein
MIITTTPFDGWVDFKSSLIRELSGSNRFERGRYLFRGQRCAGWTLTPSYDRWFARLSFPVDLKRKIEADLLASFRVECEGLDGDPSIWSDDVKTRALAQHFGVPTRLLDWTESPYIAAFFALSDALVHDRPTSAVSVWALDTQHPVWSSDAGVTLVTVPSVGNIRLRNQSGRFTLSRTPFPALEEFTEHCNARGAIQRFLIPVVDAEAAIADLDAMGITHALVYPDALGRALAAVMRVRLANPGPGSNGSPNGSRPHDAPEGAPGRAKTTRRSGSSR